jgi:hypothetical protein
LVYCATWKKDIVFHAIQKYLDASTWSIPLQARFLKLGVCFYCFLLVVS